MMHIVGLTILIHSTSVLAQGTDTQIIDVGLPHPQGPSGLALPQHVLYLIIYRHFQRQNRHESKNRNETVNEA